MQQLTMRQRKLYEFIKEKIESRGYGPTVREIGDAFHIKSPNGVMCHLNALVTKGLIIRQGKSARAIQFVDHQPPGAAPSYGEDEKTPCEKCVHLQERVETLEQQVSVLKDEAQVREVFIADMKEQIRCPDCQRPRSEWY